MTTQERAVQIFKNLLEDTVEGIENGETGNFMGQRHPGVGTIADILNNSKHVPTAKFASSLAELGGCVVASNWQPLTVDLYSRSFTSLIGIAIEAGIAAQQTEELEKMAQ